MFYLISILSLNYIRTLLNSATSLGLVTLSHVTQLQRIFHRPPYEAICSTTPASKNLCAFLKSVMHFIRMKDNECYKTRGYRRCWFVTNIDDVFREIYLSSKAYNHVPSTSRPCIQIFHTTNFSTIYKLLSRKPSHIVILYLTTHQPYPFYQIQTLFSWIIF